MDSILQRKTILLLDALDEDVLAAEDLKSRLNSLVRATFRYKTVILTCRTQFFPSESEEPHATTLYKFSLDGRTYDYFKKIYLSRHSDKSKPIYRHRNIHFGNSGAFVHVNERKTLFYCVHI